MSIKTIRVTITRDSLIDRKNSGKNLFIAAIAVRERLLLAGVPVIGLDGVIAVERGTLTIEHEDGLDGDEFHYTFVGEPVMPEVIDQVRRIGKRPSLITPLAVLEAEMRATLAKPKQPVAAKVEDDDEL
jgi:hypothetical protein